MRTLGVLLALLAAAPLWSAELAAVPETVHPLLMSDVSYAAHPFWVEISRQTDALSRLTDSAAVDSALAQASARGPAARLAAAAIARTRTEPAALEAFLAHYPDRDRAGDLASTLERLPAAGGDSGSPARQLADLSRSEPALRAVFDGNRRDPPALRIDGRGLKVLGRGDFGVVYTHADAPGVVLKAVARSPGAMMMTLMTEDSRIADDEERTARALARAGAGPQYLGRPQKGNAEISVRERVYGENLRDVVGRRRYREAEHALVLEMLGRLAAAGVTTHDLQTKNIMLGRTVLDPRPRAYLVDGGTLLTEGAKISVEDILNQTIVLFEGHDPHAGYYQIVKTVREQLDEGLKRGRTKPPLRRLLGWLRSLYN